jgi:hypothetical protein
MISHTTNRFRKALSQLPKPIQYKVREAFEIWKRNPYYESLRFKQVHANRPIYSVRIGLGWRAVGLLEGDRMIWLWVGSHADYDKLISQV